MSMVQHLKRLSRSTSGVAMTEFALGLPLLLTAGLWGAEMANYALVNMKVSQLALQLADNGSRIGDTSSLQNRKIYESDINDVFYGAQLQSGKSISLYDNARVFISSVEVKVATAGGSESQYIHWQRCRGAKNVASSYGTEGTDLGTTGIGPSTEKVVAQAGDAVIYVQVNYTYQPLISSKIITNRDIHAIASFTVRDNRDLTQIYQRDAGKPDPVQKCDTLKGNMVVSAKGLVS
ncbi:MAG: pilus assembly protein [Novosphingobium sp.]|uniref:TadE/TadG family type IV pilus assembly protein n=1 Tax=Novosphingobium sp. TaxID=1874826 RepID=UPI0032BDFE1B